MTQRQTAAVERALMVHGSVARCMDCRSDTVFVPIEAFDGEFACTSCGAAFLIDPLLISVDPAPRATRRAS